MRNRRIVNRRDGMALLLVITVVALMTILVVDRFQVAWIESALAAGFRDDTKALFRAQGGVEAARMILVEDARNKISHDALTEEWAQTAIPIPIDDDFVFVSIRDESGKFDLNRLTSDKGYPQERFISIFKRMLTNLELDEELADTVVDWIDPNDEPRASGAESGYYRSLDNPYNVKNDKFDSIEELSLVKGFTDDPKVMGKLLPLITIWSSGKININTAKPEVLLGLHERMTEELVKGILRYRIEKPFKRKEDIKKVSGMSELYPEIALAISVKSDIYSIESNATVGENSKTVSVVLRRSESGTKTLYHRIR